MRASFEKDGQKIFLEAYVTPEFSLNRSFIEGPESLNWGGLPLEYKLAADVMTMTYTATEVSKELAPDVFIINADDYELMKPEEFSKIMSGF